MAGGTLLRDTILQALCTLYLTTNQAREVAATPVNALAAAVATFTFVAHTAAELFDEEMEVNTHHSRLTQAWAFLPLSPNSPSGTCSIACQNPQEGPLPRTSDGGAKDTPP